ncbi:MAG TPA: hypothetical protein VF655_11685 [Allosphingosinicella sp.]|jgi:hypothetical protein
MPAHSLFRLLLAFALLLMPLAMAGQGHAMAAAPAHGSAMAMGDDCHESGAPAEQNKSRHEGAAQCAIACAALPSFEARIAETLAPTALPLFTLPVLPASGLGPEAETPPPRIA